ncbi:Ig-like domain-containing protein [Fructobacillus sp. M158]|uniref:collagen binding domain-containing protein n=1 Tax=Fructobacillus parabroussonetiae TaxID=2713174 RepID=UPI00200A94C6|nr:collagen binding domain-containing protein [Fructobacillus parabroussonetiae]MCK8617722.1 Ig-like domain-containing protein [Fructobacillus parabroussonetiae]
MTNNKQRIRSLYLLSLAVLAWFFMAFLATQPVNASETNSYLTSVTLKDTTDPSATTHFGPVDDLQVNYGFHIPKGSLSSENNTLTVQLPDQFSLQSSLNFDLKDSSGNVIGNAVADPNTKKVNVTFTSQGINENKNGDLTGEFHVALKWDLNVVSTATTITIHWNLPDSDGTTPNSTNVIINPATGPDPNEKLSKWSWPDKQNPKIFHWAIRVNYKKQQINDAVLSDQLGPGQKFVGTFSGRFVVYDANGTLVKSVEYYTDSAFKRDSDTAFHIDLGDINSTYIIYYETEVTDNGAMKNYGNTADLTGKNIATERRTVYSPSYSGGGSANSNGSGGDTPNTPNTPSTPSTPNTPSTPALPENSNQSNDSQSKTTSAPASTSQAAAPAALPATGKKATSLLTVVGLMAGLTTAGLYFITRQKK